MGNEKFGRIVIAGKTRLAVTALDIFKSLQDYEGYKLYAVPADSDPKEDSWQPSFQKHCKKHGIQITCIEEVASDDTLLLSLEYDKMIDIDKCRCGMMVNVHFSLLPKYKGCWTSILPILNGEDETGVTMHFIDAGIDTGDIITQRVIRICSGDTAWSLYHKYIRCAEELIKNCFREMIFGKLSGIPQPLAGSTYYSKSYIHSISTSISLRSTANQIDRMVRAFCFPVYQTALYDGKPVFKVSVIQKKSAKRTGVVARSRDGAYTDVQCIDAVLRLHHRGGAGAKR